MGINNTFNPDDYSGNVQNAVTAARAAGGTVVLSAGKTYTVSTPVVIDWPGGGIESATAGMRATLQSSVANKNVIELLGGTGFNENNFVRGLIIRRSVAPAVGSHGIIQTNKPGGNDYLSKAHIHDCEIFHHDVGIKLGGTDYGTIGDLMVRDNLSHGVELYAGTYVSLQWYWEGQTLLQRNGGHGLYVHSNPAIVQPRGIPGGNVRDVHTYNNKKYGMLFQGSANCPLQGIRVANCFIGEDLFDGIFLDTYGENHVLSNLYVEMSGQRGIYFSTNNRHYRIENCAVLYNNFMGIASMGNDAIITGCQVNGNGVSGTMPWGIYTESLRQLITSNWIGNGIGPGVGYTQDIGIVAGPTSSGRIAENNLYGNNSLTISNGSTAMSVGYNIV